MVIVAEITSQREVASRFYEILPWLFCFADHNMGSALTDFGLYRIFSPAQYTVGLGKLDVVFIEGAIN